MTTTTQYTIFTIASFVRTVHLRRALVAVDDNPHLNFWRVIYGNCVDIGVIDWCKLFGNDDAKKQPTHWKNQIPTIDHDDFRAGLRSVLGLTQQEWEAYREAIVKYRNIGAAHLQPDAHSPDDTYPVFDKALEAVYFYYDRLLAIPKNAAYRARHPKDLRAYSQRFEDQARKIAILSLSATANVPEQVL